MKTKSACLGVLILAALLWCCWSVAYRRGYSRGARDEFACWKQEPTSVQGGRDATIVGHRNLWLLPGGKQLPTRVSTYRSHMINNVPSRVLP